MNRLEIVRKRANKLYRKYGLSVPVDLNIIIRERGIELIFEENKHGIDGLCQLQKNPPKIILNTENTYEPRRRFTLAHEIGHICIPWHTGVDLCSLDNPYVRIQGQQMVNTQELEANTFASELLMPAEWLLDVYHLKSDDFEQLIRYVRDTANASIMACFYALENVLPAGDLFLIKTDFSEYWKLFRGVNTTSFNISINRLVEFYDEFCLSKKEFRLSQYNIIQYEVLPEPNYSLLNSVYLSCESNLVSLLDAITGGDPILAIPYINKIINYLDDLYYVIISTKGDYVRHFRSENCAIRMHCEQYDDMQELQKYIQAYFNSYGQVDFSSTTCMLWVKEPWLGNDDTSFQGDPHDLLKSIVSELYPQEYSKYMLQSINGVIANINGRHPTAKKSDLCHYAKIKFETDPKYEDFSGHEDFSKYILSKIDSLIVKRLKKQNK